MILPISSRLLTAVFVLSLFAGTLLAKEKNAEVFSLPKLALKEDNGIAAKFRDTEELMTTKIQTSAFKTPERINSISEKLSLLSEIGDSKDAKRTSVVYQDFESLPPFSKDSRDELSKEYIKKISGEFKYWEDEKHLGVLVAELAIVEFIPWAISKWITKPGWANVGWKSWWNNIQKGWEYDGDNFLTNNFAHPYHGNLYFNSARTNGYTFWESVPFAFTGSLLWEYFGEYYRPSFNDWINTSVSGFNLGEMTYRVSNLITDNTTRGSERVWSEIFGALVNPVRGFNRLISGEASKVHPNVPLYSVPVRLYVDGGMRRITERGSDFTGDSVSTEGLVGFDLRYGDPNVQDFSKPFNYFRVSGHFSNGSNKLTDLFSYGNLAGWKLGGKNKNRQFFTLNIAYNFITNPAYEFGGPGILGLFQLRNMLGKKIFLKSDLGMYAILMGSTSTEYFYGEDGRNYDFGPGPGILLASSITDGNWDYLKVVYSGFTIFTVSGSEGSKHYLHNGSLSGMIPVNDYFALGLEAGFYWRNSLYRDPDPDVSRTSPMGRLFFITKL